MYNVTGVFYNYACFVGSWGGSKIFDVWGLHESRCWARGACVQWSPVSGGDVQNCRTGSGGV